MNRYKPRYKIAFQSKSKVWPYKDSRLRRFFNIRGRKLVRRGFFKRYVLVFNNMKWTIARRYIRPYMRRRKAVRRRFRNAFYNKQQLRAFHGKVKETAFRKNFQKYLNSGANRNRSFFASLERRLDMFFFRMRLLPTIFACNQYILQHGVLVNRGIERSPNALLRPGDVVSLDVLHWKSFYVYFRQRLKYRLYGKRISLKRKFSRLKKKTWGIRRLLKLRKWVFLLKQKRVFLDLLILKSTKRFLNSYKIFRKIWEKMALRILEWKPWTISSNYSKEEWKTFLLNALNNRKRVLSEFNKFLFLEKQRRKLFYNVYSTWKQDFNTKSKQSSQFKLKFKFSDLTKEKKKAKTKKILFFSKTKKLKNKNFIKTVIYALGMLFQSYSNWLTIKLKFRIEESRFYYFILFFLSSIFSKQYDLTKIKNLIKSREILMVRKTIFWRKKLLSYYNLFFHRFVREKTLKSFFKSNPKLDKKTLRGNLLTYFLIRHQRRLKQTIRIPRLKKVHWAIPSYMYFDARTLRAVLLYQPTAKQIHYSFKCSLSGIASFYKSLAL